MQTLSLQTMRIVGLVMGLAFVFLVLAGSARADAWNGSTGMEWYTVGSPHMYTTGSDVFGAGIYSRMGSLSPWQPGGYYPNWSYWMRMFPHMSMYGDYDNDNDDYGSGGGSGGYGAHCGGFIQNAPTCQAGFHCQLNPQRPDSGGMCVPNTNY